MPIHTGSQFTLGQAGSEEVHTLSMGELPVHLHPLTATTAAADNVDPTGNLFAQPATAIYTAPGAPSAMKSTLIGFAGGNQPHENQMPYLVLSFCIALQGVFPSRN
jgi:microcystin-dependent protein